MFYAVELLAAKMVQMRSEKRSRFRQRCLFTGAFFHSSGKNQRRTLILWEDFCGRKDIAKTENRRSGLPGPPGCRRSQGSGRGSLEEKRKRRCTAGKCSEETKPARGPFRFYSSSKKYLPLIGMRKRREEIGCFHYSIFGRRDKKPGCARHALQGLPAFLYGRIDEKTVDIRRKKPLQWEQKPCRAMEQEEFWNEQHRSI